MVAPKLVHRDVHRGEARDGSHTHQDNLAKKSQAYTQTHLGYPKPKPIELWNEWNPAPLRTRTDPESAGFHSWNGAVVAPGQSTCKKNLPHVGGKLFRGLHNHSAAKFPHQPLFLPTAQ